MIALKKVYLIDMDRCSLNTESIMTRLAEVLESLGVDHKTAEAERQVALQDSGYVDVWEHLRTKVLINHEATMEDVSIGMQKTVNDQSFLYPDASRVFELLSGKAVVMTFGNPEWQLLKARICGIDQLAPMLVVDTHKKAQLIAAAKQQNSYVFNVGETIFKADSVVLIDDKADAFIGLPTDCYGYQINNGEWSSFQLGDLPPNARKLDDFSAFIREELQ